MSGIRSLTRRPTAAGFASAGSAPIYVNSSDNSLRTIPAGTGTTEVVITDSRLVKAGFSTATVSAGYAVDTLLQGSAIAAPTSGFLAGSTYLCVLDMVKTAAGTATPIITLHIGTTGTVADAAILTFTFGAGTAAVDTGTFSVNAHFRTVGSGTTAVMVGVAACQHALAATGLISTGASGNGQISVVSSGFDSTPTGQIISLSFNGGASFSGTSSLIESFLRSV
jgi:hypothetical protein